MSKPHTIEFVNKIAQTKGGKCLNKTYKNQKEKLYFECSEGHIFKRTFDALLNQNQWCTKCNRNLSEEICRYVFENLLNVKFEKIKFNYKGHCLELDGYNKENNIAFEYNGRQHYELTTLIKSEQELEYRKYLDDLKIEYCKKSRIKLFIIPYTVKNDDLIQHIKTLLKIESKNRVNINNFIENYSYYKLRKEHIKKIVEQNGGKLLKFNFNSVEIKCKNNHIWKSIYSTINNGHWCKICANTKSWNAPISSFQNIESILEEKKIICLDKEKYKSRTSVLTFRCENGHIFTDTISYLLDRFNDKNKKANRKMCQLCISGRQSKVLEKIKKFGLKLLDINDYKNKTQYIDWVCENNVVQNNSLRNLTEKIRRGTALCKCEECSKNIKK